MNIEDFERIKNNKELYKNIDDTYRCPECSRNFTIKGFIQHVKKEHYNKNNGINNSGGYNGHYKNVDFLNKLKKSNREYYNKKLGEIIEKIVKCSKCGKSFSIIERSSKNKEKYFCSKKCANSHDRTSESKNKTSLSLIKYYNTQKKRCVYCNNEITSRRAKYCSSECRKSHKLDIKLNKTVSDTEKEKILIRKYRTECSFKFNLSDYPNEFNFELIKKFGWYKAKNNGNNLCGVSRDHMYSVMDGYRNNINPNIISHPANCRLITHSENISKGDKSIITIENLLERIDIWNKKYDKF